jgi:hypothetical protein
MYPFTQSGEGQRESRPAKSPRAGELTGSSWIKLPKRQIFVQLILQICLIYKGRLQSVSTAVKNSLLQRRDSGDSDHLNPSQTGKRKNGIG